MVVKTAVQDNTATLDAPYWKTIPLAEMVLEQWEALCDGCGLCCLLKLEDEDTHEVAYTKVACQLLDVKTAQCSNYTNRKTIVPDCLQLTPALVPTLKWLPQSCAYRRVHEGKDLPRWHPLITGTPRSVREARKSVAGRCISELDVLDDDLEDYVVRWVL